MSRIALDRKEAKKNSAFLNHRWAIRLIFAWRKHNQSRLKNWNDVAAIRRWREKR